MVPQANLQAQYLPFNRYKFRRTMKNVKILDC